MSERSYTAQELFSLGARVNNAKRSYLLVNPLQAKHIPVSPGETITMCRALCAQLPDICRKEPALLIGFAETATAIGAIVAAELGAQCGYLTTTREQFDTKQPFLYFSEAHSHANEQKLCTDRLPAMLRNAKSVILLDDELTTGNTILNLLDCLAPYLYADCEKIAVSVINRMNPAAKKRFAARGVQIAALCYSEDTDATEEDYTARTTKLSAAAVLPCADGALPAVIRVKMSCAPRIGTNAADYARACRAIRTQLKSCLPREADARILILGTEECMAPAVWTGAALEADGCTVRCHATTRSPIAVCDKADYPARTGVQLKSVYDAARVTYLYNLGAYDAAFILFDAQTDYEPGLRSLCGALEQYNTKNIIAVQISTAD